MGGDGQFDGAPGTRRGVGRRVAAAVPDSVDDDAELQVLACFVAFHWRGRAEREAHCALGGAADADDRGARRAR